MSDLNSANQIRVLFANGAKVMYTNDRGPNDATDAWKFKVVGYKTHGIPFATWSPLFESEDEMLDQIREDTSYEAAKKDVL